MCLFKVLLTVVVIVEPPRKVSTPIGSPKTLYDDLPHKIWTQIDRISSHQRASHWKPSSPQEPRHFETVPNQTPTSGVDHRTRWRHQPNATSPSHLLTPPSTASWMVRLYGTDHTITLMSAGSVRTYTEQLTSSSQQPMSIPSRRRCNGTRKRAQ